MSEQPVVGRRAGRSESDRRPATTLREWLGGRPLSPLSHAVLGFGIPAIIACTTMARAWSHTVDDAFISYRYARNFARGAGLVYNVGERIEGYTNFLWTVLLGVGIKVGLDPEVLAKLLGAATALGALWLVYRIEARLRPLRSVPALSPYLLASSAVFFGHAVFGLETGLFAVLLLAGTWLFWREEERAAALPWSGLVFGAAGLTRPEAPLFLGLLMLFLGGQGAVPLGRWLLGREDRPEERTTVALASIATLVAGGGLGIVLAPVSLWQRALGYAVVAIAASVLLAHLPRALWSRRNLLRGVLFVMPVAAHLTWRKSYYGHWLPNTLMAKTGDLHAQLNGGLGYLGSYLSHEGTAAYLALFGVAAGLARRRHDILALAATLLCGAAYVVLVGGDWMPLFRFMTPLQPLLLLLAGLGARALLEARNRVARGGVLLLGVLVTCQRATTILDDDALVEREKSFWERAAGGVSGWFAARAEARGAEQVRGAIALGDIGQVGYRSDYPILDLLGLVDPVIAALPGGYTTKLGPGFRNRFFDEKPRYFILISGNGDCDHPTVAGSITLYHDPRFRRQYRLDGRIPLDGGISWCVYEHVSRADASPPAADGDRSLDRRDAPLPTPLDI